MKSVAQAWRELDLLPIALQQPTRLDLDDELVESVLGHRSSFRTIQGWITLLQDPAARETRQ
jgi:hypothetical protein